MKKLIFVMLFATVGLFSCEDDLSTCKSCKQVQVDPSGIKTTVDAEKNYCGDDLNTVQGEKPVTIDGYTTQWECR